MDLQIVQGDIREATEKYICHQCNCLTDHSAGMAAVLFSCFPYADIYSKRKGVVYSPKNLIPGQTPGQILICGNGQNQRYIVNMFGQLYPGKPKFPNSSIDGFEARQRYFNQCLTQLSSTPDLQSVCFPFGIGCNMAGGDWTIYHKMIEGFAIRTGVLVRIYQKFNQIRDEIFSAENDDIANLG